MGLSFAITGYVFSTILCAIKGVSEDTWQIVRAINFACLTIVVAMKYGA